MYRLATTTRQSTKSIMSTTTTTTPPRSSLYEGLMRSAAGTSRSKDVDHPPHYLFLQDILLPAVQQDEYGLQIQKWYCRHKTKNKNNQPTSQNNNIHNNTVHHNNKKFRSSDTCIHWLTRALQDESTSSTRNVQEESVVWIQVYTNILLSLPREKQEEPDAQHCLSTDTVIRILLYLQRRQPVLHPFFLQTLLQQLQQQSTERNSFLYDWLKHWMSTQALPPALFRFWEATVTCLYQDPSLVWMKQQNHNHSILLQRLLYQGYSSLFDSSSSTRYTHQIQQMWKHILFYPDHCNYDNQKKQQNDNDEEEDDDDIQDEEEDDEEEEDGVMVDHHDAGAALDVYMESVMDLHHHPQDDDDDDDDDEEEDENDSTQSDEEEDAVMEDDEEIQEDASIIEDDDQEEPETHMPALYSNANNNQQLTNNQNNVTENSQQTSTHNSTEAQIQKYLPPLAQRNQSLVQCAAQVLEQIYPPPINATSTQSQNRNSFPFQGETALLSMIQRTIKPSQKPLQFKIVMKRASTQEEFFRGNLSQNPIDVQSLKTTIEEEPTVADLRHQIAVDLQMADSAELIEILVADKIIDVSVKLRVLFQTVWREYWTEHLQNNGNGNADSTAARRFFSFSGLGSAVFLSSSSSKIPPMVAVYRLAGVDGEATEDTIDNSNLVDPMEAEMSDVDLEKEYALAGYLVRDRGVYALLRSVEFCLGAILRRIRLDDNYARDEFRTNPPHESLILLDYCCKLAVGRRRLLQARAPTILLNLLLEVLHVLESSETSLANADASGTSVSPRAPTVTSSPTADKLQELIEILASDISSDSKNTDMTQDDGPELDVAQDSASLPMLLQSVQTISLSVPLRKIVAKLLPFLTYGQTSLSKELAMEFDRCITSGGLSKMVERESDSETTTGSILTDTLIQTAKSLPPSEVCSPLRLQLVRCGFVDRLIKFILKDLPKHPPSWSSALAKPNKELFSEKMAPSNYKPWRVYFTRNGIRTAFKMLTGLSRNHSVTQERCQKPREFLIACHWLESTSDYPQESISTDGLALLAETLLDELMNNKTVAKTIEDLRHGTRTRKKEIAAEQRKRALLKMSSFTSNSSEKAAPAKPESSLFSPVLSLFRSGGQKSESPTESPESLKEKPAWMREMEMMEDEDGLMCSVCQEGRKLQPKEVLGIYAFVKRVVLSVDRCGAQDACDGTLLLKNFPSHLPSSLNKSIVAKDWFPGAKATVKALEKVLLSSTSRRSSSYVTTVSASNGIHIHCHRMARIADRDHARAPKSEWEGASLRNNRVKCNTIIPLVKGNDPDMPVLKIDSALSDYSASMDDYVRDCPKSRLWIVLHDIRLLLLRISYGESLSYDCEGGSLPSNCQLLFYQFCMAAVLEREAELDKPHESHHAQVLPKAFLTCCATILAKDCPPSTAHKLTDKVADAAFMAGLICVFHGESEQSVWKRGRELFLQGMILAAGRRHARGAHSSGCDSNRGTKRKRSSSFAEWCDEESNVSTSVNTSKNANIDDFRNALRPAITYFGILDKLHSNLSLNIEDNEVQDFSDNLSRTIEAFHKCKNIRECLKIGNIQLKEKEIMDLLMKGLVAAS